MTPKNWDKSSIENAKKILGKHLTTIDALPEISNYMGRNIGARRLREVFADAQAGGPGSYLKHVFDPITLRDQRDAKEQERKNLEGLISELRVTRERQKFIDTISDMRESPRIMPREKNSKMREMSVVVLASDWHVEEPVEPESVAYRNEYNLAIAEKRIERFFQGIIWNVEHHRASKRIAIRDLILWLGGDLMTGYIHEELVESNALSPTETIIWLIPKIRDGIATLLDHLKLDHIEIPCSFGNHGRTTPKRRISTGYANSFEWLMYHQIAAEFRKEKRIHFEITNSPHQYVHVYDFVLHFHHGDDVRYQGGIGGLGIPLLKAVPGWDLVKKADVHNIGHHHSLRDYGRAVVNGSLIGFNPYAQSIRAEFEEPAQALYFVDSHRGKCMPTSIWVGDESKQEMPEVLKARIK